MDFIVNFFTELSQFFRQWDNQIAVGFVATLLVVFGDDLSKLLKKWISKFHFIVRLLIFVVVCAIGFTLLADWANRVITDLFDSIPDRWYSIVILGGFTVLGMLAERKKYM